MDLFSYAEDQLAAEKLYKPLAERMRPRNFTEFVGQSKAVGAGKFLRRLIEQDQIPSLILFGPPGTGKTTLAQMIAELSSSHFEKLNAVAAGISDIRRIVAEAKERRTLYRTRTIVFIDEIHRFHKGQQDVLLPYVEDGRLTLIGATTENPYFEVNLPLLSRMRVVQLELLAETELLLILKRALADKERGLGTTGLYADEAELLSIARLAGGDARMALNILEQAAALTEKGGTITAQVLYEVVGERLQAYDKTGDSHYNTVSAFIKSMRGSDPDAALHYLARMLVAGEDLNFIARRIVICAAEDVGNADPQALVIAMAAAEAVRFLGMPEARIPLAQAVTYVAGAPKSNAAYLAIDRALADVRGKDCGTIPTHLCDAHYKGAAKLGCGIGYKYAHDYPEHFVKQTYLPDKLAGIRYYEPTENGAEKAIKLHLEHLWRDGRQAGFEGAANEYTNEEQRQNSFFMEKNGYA